MFISEKEHNALKKLVLTLEKKHAELLKGLGEAADSGSGTIEKAPGYIAVKQQIQLLEYQLAQYREKLQNGEIISDPSVLGDFVSVYSLIETENLDTKQRETYYLCHVPADSRSVSTGFGERRATSNTEKNGECVEITPESPLGEALVGRQKRNVVEVDTGSRKIRLRILSIRHEIR